MKNPKIFPGKPAHEMNPWAIWIWNHTISREKIISQLKAFADAGFCGIAIRPGKDLFPIFLSEEFFDIFDVVLSVAKEHNVQIRIAEDFTNPENTIFGTQIRQKKNLRLQQLVLEQTVVPMVHEDLTLHVDKPENTVILAVKIDDHQITLGDTKVLTVKSDNNVIVWKSVSGEWRILIFRKQYVENCTQEFIPNVLGTNTAELYIQNVLDILKARFASYMPSVFSGILCEVPFVRPADSALPWDDDIVSKYKSHHKKDLIKLLPALFFENCVQSSKIRQSFYSFLSDTVYQQFISPIEAWSKKNHLTAWVLHPEKNIQKSCNEFIGELTGEFSTTHCSGLQNIAGIHENCVQLKHFHDCGANETRQGILTVIGRNTTGYGSSLQSLKSEFDYSSIICQSIPLIDGFHTDFDLCAAQKSPISPDIHSPEWPFMKNLCTYISRVRELCRDIKWVSQAAVLSPVSAMISDYYPNNSEYAKKGFAIFQKTLSTLDRLSITYDCVSDEMLSACDVNEKGEVILSAKNHSSSYKAIIIPFAPLMSKALLSFIEKAVQKGTSVFFIDEITKGTFEDGITSAISGRILKLIDPKKNHVAIVKSDSPDSRLAEIETPFFAVANSRRDSDACVSWGKGDNFDIFILHNKSDLKDLQVHVELPEYKHFSFADCETGEVYEIENFEKYDGKAQFDFGFMPHETIFILGSSSKIASHVYAKNQKSGVNVFALHHRSYRIVLKDQWNFSTHTLNSFPLGNWNLRIGLSRDSGGFSYLYESSIQIKTIPQFCALVLNDLSLIQQSVNCCDCGIELMVNGTKVDRQESASFPAVQVSDNLPEINISELFSGQQLTYNISSFLINGNNRFTIRTTGKPCNIQSMHVPPVLLGDFTIVKEKATTVLDTVSETAKYGGWTKCGYPYFSGKGIYKQVFEVPSEYKQIILRFSKVSASVQLKLNGKDLGIFNWHPMQADITAYCQQKRNEIEISVLNTVDNLVRLNGHPSGLIGEVYLDIY